MNDESTTTHLNANSRRRWPIAQSLFAWMFVQVLLCVLVIGLAMSWNLRRGFSQYVIEREAVMLESFASAAAESIVRNNGLEGLRHRPRLMRELLESVAGRQAPETAPAGPRAGPPGGPPPRRDLERPEHAGPPGHPLRGGDFRGRVAIHDLNGERVTGFPLGADEQSLSLPITVNGEVVAYAVSAIPAESDGVDAEFLRQQFLLISIAAIALLLCAAITSWLMAKRWAAPLKDIQGATARVADGDFDVRLTERGSVEIAGAIRNINAMVAALKRLETARRRWLADISHELRTPVTVLRGEIECLSDGVRQPTEAVINSLRDEVVAVSALLDDVHLVSMADLGKMPCQFAEMDMVALAKRASGRFQAMASEKGLELAFSSDFDEAIVVADVGRIDQVLRNLLTNAIKYTSAPGRVMLSVVASADGTALVIEDSAPSPDPEEIDHLFEPFYRTEDSRNGLVGGSGLGLAVCKAIVEAHHGRISASPSSLDGLCIRIDLPNGG
ncbi:ATP-binding protein [Dokdonella sp.]|uniref:ATP-binding protein n=1 Tax=Dokdonella sp. TaxID=2291710 RepID=UPI003C6783B9